MSSSAESDYDGESQTDGSLNGFIVRDSQSEGSAESQRWEEDNGGLPATPPSAQREEDLDDRLRMVEMVAAEKRRAEKNVCRKTIVVSSAEPEDNMSDDEQAQYASVVSGGPRRRLFGVTPGGGNEPASAGGCQQYVERDVKARCRCMDYLDDLESIQDMLLQIDCEAAGGACWRREQTR
ncbi:hypothetical protein MY4824_002090 [Beauveria thailandica]